MLLHLFLRQNVKVQILIVLLLPGINIDTSILNTTVYGSFHTTPTHHHPHKNMTHHISILLQEQQLHKIHGPYPDVVRRRETASAETGKRAIVQAALKKARRKGDAPAYVCSLSMLPCINEDGNDHGWLQVFRPPTDSSAQVVTLQVACADGSSTTVVIRWESLNDDAVVKRVAVMEKLCQSVIASNTSVRQEPGQGGQMFPAGLVRNYRNSNCRPAAQSQTQHTHNEHERAQHCRRQDLHQAMAVHHSCFNG